MISVIIPVYNTETYIDRCLSSVVSQSEKDLEIILIDDCSTDGTREKLMFWAEKDSRIRVIYKEQNRGVSDSRNRGLELSTGEYISFVDSDDSVEPDYYRNFLNHLEHSDADIAFGTFQRVYRDRIEPNRKKEESGSVLDTLESMEYCIPAMGKSWFDGYIWDKLYCRSALIKDGSLILFDETIRFAEDSLWLMHVLANISKALIVNEAVYCYDCEREGSAHLSVYDEGNAGLAAEGVNAYRYILELVKDKGVTIADNVLQRMIIYRKLACRGTAMAGDNKLFYDMKQGYVSMLSDWLKRHHSPSDLKWAVKQFASYCYSFVRVHFRKNKQS